MTQKDIRDIAAYWGVLFKGQGRTDIRFLMDENLETRVTGNVLNYLKMDTQDSFKLQLRPIASLTDEELTECARIDSGGEFLHGGVTEINRYSDEINVQYANGAVVRFAVPEVFHTYQDAGQVAQTIAYLQSIGVYVPGTIDEKYVELIL